MPRYRVQDERCGEDFDAADDDAALEYGEEWLRDGDWDRSQTIWLSAEVVQLKADGEYADTLGSVYVTLMPDVPACTEEAHLWCAPYSLLGGLKDNPGVWGNGGGIRSKEVCQHCGRYRLTDTWATNPCDGTQGHTSVEYLPADEDSLEWSEKFTQEDSDD